MLYGLNLGNQGITLFYSYDGADIDITKLSVQSFLIHLTTEISKKWNYLRCIIQIIIQNHLK